jgi:hypothetical protein
MPHSSKWSPDWKNRRSFSAMIFAQSLLFSGIGRVLTLIAVSDGVQGV